eukprot:3018294-Pyramimonas_sp.AAC.1
MRPLHVEELQTLTTTARHRLAFELNRRGQLEIERLLDNRARERRRAGAVPGRGQAHPRGPSTTCCRGAREGS